MPIMWLDARAHMLPAVLCQSRFTLICILYAELRLRLTRPNHARDYYRVGNPDTDENGNDVNDPYGSTEFVEGLVEGL